MNGCETLHRCRVVTFVLLAGAGLGLLSLLQAEAGAPGLVGQAQSKDTFNFSELAERELQVGVSATTPGPRPTLRKSSAPRGGARPLLSAVEPDTNTVALAAEPAPALPFAAASGGVPSPPPSASFEAVADDDTVFNPDTHGAVGPNHLMVTLASQVRVQDRTGGALQTLSLNAFWGTAGNSNVYDPRVLYDRAAQRWITTALCNPSTNNSSILIAVSQTSDPTGAWTRRAVRTDITNPVFPDSPNVGLTRDAITVTANMFNKNDFNYFSCDIWVFNKANLYSGGTGQFTFFRYLDAWLGEASVLVPVVNYDNGATNILISNFDGDFATPDGNFGYLRFFSITGPVGGESFNDFGGPGGTNGVYVGLFTPWGSYPPNFANFAPQKNSTNKIYIGDARIQNAIYRDGFVWLSQHIFQPASAPYRVGLQWLSITPGGTINQVGILSDSLGVNHYAYPSLAVNADGDMLLGFTSFSPNQYPTASYALHSYEDLNSLHLPGTLKPGETNYFINDRGINHWGDWSATVVDPLNDTDFWTIQEYASRQVGGESRWGTWWGRISPQADLSVAQTDAPDPIVAGSTVTYSISITNLLFTLATGTRVLDTLPLGAVFVSATSSIGSCGHTNGVVTCHFGDLAGDSIYTATVVARLNQSGTATNSVTVSSYGSDVNASDNTVRVLTTVNPAADLTVLMTASANPVTVSNTLSYLVTATNRGPSVATAVQLTDTLPAGVTFVAATPGQGSCSQNAGVVSCNLGTLVIGGAVSVNVQVRPTAAGQLTNRATVVTSALDPVSGNNSTTNIIRANSAPTMQAISNRTIAEDSVLSPIDFTVGDLETPAGSLILGGSSSDLAIVPNANIVFGGSGSLRNIRVTPLPNANGNVTITRIITDADGGSLSNSFVLTVTPVSDPPSISGIAPQLGQEDQSVGPILFSVDDADSGAAGLTMTGASSNPALIPNANISFGGSGGFRSLTVRPATNQFGTATITVSVSDGTATTNTSFVVTIASVNDLPSMTDLGDRSINEDTPTSPIAFTVSDIETTAGALTLSGSASNPSLLPSANFTFGGSGANRTVIITPATNQFGTATVTISVTDTNGGIGTDTFVLTVNPVNDPPTVGVPATVTVNEDAGQQTVVLTNITAGGVGESQPVSFLATSSNPQLIPNPTVSYTSPATVGSLLFTPVANSNGTATLTLTANDASASNNITTRQILVTVTAVNDPPTVSDVPDQSINEDTSTATLAFTLTDIDSPATSFSVAGASSNPVLVPAANIVFGGTGASRTVRVTPAPDQTGSATISILASDGAATNTETFVLTVLPLNDLPTLSVIVDRTINEDAPTNISFTITDPDTPAANLTLSATSSNPALVPAIGFGGTGSNRTVNIVPAANQSGTALITVRVADQQGSNSTSFQLTVVPVNDPPTLDPIVNRSVLEDAPGPINVPLTGITSGAANEVQSLSVTALSSDPLIIPHPTVSYLSPNTSGSLAFTPAHDSNGTVTITVVVSDGTTTNARSFDVTIQPVNDPPILGRIPDQTIDEDTTITLPFYVSDLETPGAQLSLQADSSNTELLDSTGISFGGSGTNRTLILTPVLDASGSSTIIELSVIDAGSASASISFELTVRPINDRPRITGLSNTTIAEDAAATRLNFTVSDPETLPSAVTVTATSSNQALLPNANVQLGGTGSARTLTVTPLPNLSGTTILEVTARDGNAATTTNSIVLTVSPVNDPPTLNPLTDRTLPEDSGPQTVSLSGIGSGAANETQTMGVTALSSDPARIPNPAISYTSPNPTGTLTFTPSLNATGTVTLSVIVNDGGAENPTVTRTFQVTLTQVNDPPILTGLGALTVEENTPTTFPFTVTDLETGPNNVGLTVSSSNQGVLPNANVTLSGTGANRVLNLTPVANQLGSSVITIIAQDPEGLRSTNSYQASVVKGNDPPTLDPIAAVTMVEDEAPRTISLTGITAGPVDEREAVSITATSSNPNILPDPFVSYLSPATTGSLTLAPRANSNGVVTVTVTANDGQANRNLFTRTFTVTITPVNDAPFVMPVDSQVTSEDVPLAVNVVLIDTDTAPASITLTGSSSNPALIPSGGIAITGTGLNRTVTLTPVQNQSGFAFISLVTGDGSGLSTTNVFEFIVQPVNDLPTISDIQNANLNEDAQLSVPFTIGDVETAAAQLALAASSSDPLLLPLNRITFGGSGASRSVNLAPTTNRAGSATVTITVTDADGGARSDSFVLTVNPVNDPPTLTGLPNLSVTRGGATGPLPVTIGDVETPAAGLNLTATSSNQGLVPNANIALGGTGFARTVTVTAAGTQTGTATITLTLADGNGGSTNTSFTVSVQSVNNPPTLNPLSNLTLSEDPGLQIVSLTGISAGGSDVQPITVQATSSNPALIPNPSVVYGTPNPTGSLSFTPVANASGAAVITVTVSDGAPQDGSFSRSFTVTLNSVNDAPTLLNIADQTTAEDTPITVPFTISDPESAAFRLTLSGTSANTALVANTNIFFGGSGTNRTVTLVPSPDQNGTSTITVRVTDGVATNTDTFVLTVTAANDPPTLNPIPNFSANAANGNPAHVINLSGISAGSSESQTITVTATSSATGTIPNPTVSYSSPSATGTLTVRPGNGNTGSATITVTVSDGTASTVRTFLVGIKATANVFPTVSIVPTINLNEDTSTNVTFQVRDAETAVGSLTVRVFSSNQQLFPDASLILAGGTGTNRTLALTPLPNRIGSANITIGVVDGGFGASNMTFVVNVATVNDPPSLTGIANQSVNDTTPTPPLSFTVNDLETPPGNLTVTTTSANQTLVPNGNLFLGGAGSDRVLVATPAPNQTGSAVITVAVSDGTASTNIQFTLTVNNFNEPPTLSDLSDQAVAANTPTAAIPFTIGDSETPASNLTLTGLSSNLALVPDAAIVFGGSASNRTVTVTPTTGAAGSATITVRVSDGTNQVSDTFVLVVTAPGGGGSNTRPTLDVIPDVALSQGGAPRTVTLTGIGSGAANEIQPLILAASSSDPSIVPHPALTYASPAATGTLTLAATPFATGTATITVTISDAQAQNGTLTRTFLASINIAPALTGLTNLFVNEDTSSPALAFTVTDADDAIGTITVNATSSNAALLPASGLSLGGSGNNRTLTVTPLPGLSGLSTVTVTASDSSGNAVTRDLLVTVFPVNDAPTLAPLTNLTLPLSSSGPQTVNLLGIGSGAANESQLLAIAASSSAPDFIPDPVVNYTSPAATGSLTLNPRPGVMGSAVITVVVWDNGGIANGGLDNTARTFTVTRSGPPTLAIVATGASTAAVSWSTDAGANWVLQSNINLGNAATWSPVPGIPTVVNSRYTVNVTLSGQTVFFRLRQ